MGVIAIAILVIACLPAYGYLHDTNAAQRRTETEGK